MPELEVRAFEGDEMYQGAVLASEEAVSRRVPASSHGLWAYLDGGSLMTQPPPYAWALLPRRGALVFLQKRNQGTWCGIWSLLSLLIYSQSSKT